MVAMMMVPTMMAVPPSHFGCYRLGIFLHGRSRTGIAERQRIRPFGRRGENEHCADGGKAQNFRHLHVWSPQVSLCHVRDERYSVSKPQRRDAVQRLKLMT
jgi:hypothetical protein